jgi:hypothetical protein
MKMLTALAAAAVLATPAISLSATASVKSSPAPLETLPDSGGICTNFGCGGGPSDCVKGTAHFPNGVDIDFTCTTTVQPT